MTACRALKRIERREGVAGATRNANDGFHAKPCPIEAESPVRTLVEGERVEALSVMVAALLAAAGGLDGAAPLLRYAVWVCDRLEGDRAEHGIDLGALKKAAGKAAKAEHGDGGAPAALLRDLRERVETE